MPYIDPSARSRLAGMEWPAPRTLGELDYCITCLCLNYISYHGKSFAIFAGVAGVLDYVADETKRKMSDAYERQKETENGPVYPPI